MKTNPYKFPHHSSNSIFMFAIIDTIVAACCLFAISKRGDHRILTPKNKRASTTKWNAYVHTAVCDIAWCDLSFRAICVYFEYIR